MAIDKGLYQAPQGLEELALGEPEIEIEIADGPEIAMNSDGSVDIVFEEEKNTDIEKKKAEQQGFTLNGLPCVAGVYPDAK